MCREGVLDKLIADFAKRKPITVRRLPLAIGMGRYHHLFKTLLSNSIGQHKIKPPSIKKANRVD